MKIIIYTTLLIILAILGAFLYFDVKEFNKEDSFCIRAGFDNSSFSVMSNGEKLIRCSRSVNPRGLPSIVLTEDYLVEQGILGWKEVK